MILIFGGNGFVGQHLARQLLDQGEQVAVTTHSRSCVPRLIAKELESGSAMQTSLDVADSFAVMETVQRLSPQTVVDLTGHPPHALSPGRDVAFRTAALLNILEAARINAVDRVILMSSMDVYWGLPSSAAPFLEEDTVPLVEPDDHFIVQSWVKKSLEVIGNLYRRRHAMDIACVRASGIYGPLYRTYLNLPSRLIQAAINGFWANHAPGGNIFADGGYDQLYVKDMATGIALVVQAEKLAFPVYNIGSGRAPTYGEFLDGLGAAKPDLPVSLEPRPHGTPPDPMDGRWMSIERARAELGFEPRFDPKSGMADYLESVTVHGL